MTMVYVHPAPRTVGTVAQLRIVAHRTHCYCGRPVSVVRPSIYCNAHR